MKWIVLKLFKYFYKKEIHRVNTIAKATKSQAIGLTLHVLNLLEK